MTAYLPRRRSFLQAMGAVSLAGCSWTKTGRQRHRLKPALGFLRQTDAASLLFAEELGYYGKQDLSPVFHRAASPVELKELLVAGDVVAAQLPASLPIALAGRGLPPSPSDPITLMILSQNGAAVTLARDLCDAVKFLDLDGLKRAIGRRTSGPAVFAVPVAGGCDDLLLRYLLAAADVPTERIQIEELPADRMIAELRDERIIGFAAPDPWPALATQQDVGFTFATSQDIWQTAPRSALVTTERGLNEHRAELKAVVRAVIETSVWLDVPANRARPTIGDVLARRRYLDLDSGPIRSRLASVYDLGCKLGERDFEDDMLFFHHGGRVNAPRRADALLYLALLARFKLLPSPPSPTIVDRAIHDDLYKEVAREMGVSVPDDMKPFVVTLDAVRFDPGAPAEWGRLWSHA